MVTFLSLFNVQPQTLNTYVLVEDIEVLNKTSSKSFKIYLHNI